MCNFSDNGAHISVDLISPAFSIISFETQSARFFEFFARLEFSFLINYIIERKETQFSRRAIKNAVWNRSIREGESPGHELQEFRNQNEINQIVDVASTVSH